MKLKRSLIIIIHLLTVISVNSQKTEKLNSKYVLGFLPSTAHNIYGIAIGPVGSEAFCNINYTRKSHGINIQIPGQGLFLLFFFFSNKIIENNNDTLQFYKSIHNGMLLSILGSTTEKVNGVNISPFMSAGKSLNGVSINLLWNAYGNVKGVSIGFMNSANIVKGVQIGLINKSHKLKGFQIGLINKNDKRLMPIMNW
ncbi:MAG: hypothetical protein N2449_09375 [Bacteroidales bacterium]|nr:hypothetical protein [Bacteroidales bacterium]